MITIMGGGVSCDVGDLVRRGVVSGFGGGVVADGFCCVVPVAGVVVGPGLGAWVVRRSRRRLPRCDAVSCIVVGGEAFGLD